MDWSTILIGFALAVLMGAAAVALLTQNRPDWSKRKRVTVAASVLPAFTLVATVAVIWFIKASEHGAGQTMEDLAIRAVLTLGLGFVVLAFVGGLIGAGLSARRRG
jgi:RsiW-degrading membrane proteinase PrsW (M82 family)